jgi:hypothetical protein
MIGIFDPGLPEWLATASRDLIPRIFDFYAEMTGIPLDSKPAVFFSFEDVEISGISSGGGTLPGVIQMHAKGSNWRTAEPQSADGIYYVVAHEAAHLWNGEMVHFENESESWMHEGGADAFTFLALRHLGMLDEQGLIQRFSDSLNECLLGLEGSVLNHSVDRGQFRNYYTCGAVLALWTEAALSQVDANWSIFDFWPELIESSRAKDGKYDQNLYFTILEKMGASKSSLQAMKRFTGEPIDDPGPFLIKEFQALSVDLQVSPEEATREYRLHLGGKALQSLMVGICEGRYSVRRDSGYFVTGEFDDCAPFDKPRRVIELGGYKIMAEGDLAYDYLHRQCSRREPASLTVIDREQPLSVNCDEAIRPRQPWLQFRAKVEASPPS